MVELSGPRDVSPQEVAQTLGKILGKPINLVEAPLDAVVPAFNSLGASSDIAELFRGLYQDIRDGRVAFESAGVEARRGKTSLEETLRLLSR